MEELLGKYFSGDASDEEVRTVLEWRNASEDNARVFFETKKTWIASGGISRPAPAVLASILDESDEEEYKVIPLWDQKLFRIAVSLILILGVIFTLVQVNKTQPYGEVMTEITEFNLPDGSDVTLQRGASITIDDFGNERVVYLTGKAFFEVERDEEKPFRVITQGASIEVLGTSFVVNSIEETRATEVMVASGKVTLGQKAEAFNGKSMKIRLEKGEMGKLVIGEQGIKKKKIADINYLSWKTRVITFKKTSLRDVSGKFNEVYGMELDFEDPVLGQCQLTAKFNKKEPEEIVGLIAQTFSLSYQKSGDKFVLSGEGCK